MANSVLFGAGKIARGFVAHLLFLAGQEFVFVEQAPALVDLINARGQYTIRVLGAPDKDAVVTGARALALSDAAAIAAAVARADLIFTAVGGKNLTGIAPVLAQALSVRLASGTTSPLNLITCENWKDPAELLRQEIASRLDPSLLPAFDACVGVTEAVVMRSAVDPPPAEVAADPLVVNVQDHWVLPVDASRLRGSLPPIPGIQPIPAFAGFLERKFYTYNAANGTVSYLGHLLGHALISDAARDLGILRILEGVYEETGAALSRKHGIPLDEQMAFTRTSLAKLQDRTIVDSIERNARDPIRKLGPDDRLVGSARLCLEQGVRPVHLAVAIAAALHYDEPGDPISQTLQRMRREQGVDAVLRDVCGIAPGDPLAALVRDGIHSLQERGWIAKGEAG